MQWKSTDAVTQLLKFWPTLSKPRKRLWQQSSDLSACLATVYRDALVAATKRGSRLGLAVCLVECVPDSQFLKEILLRGSDVHSVTGCQSKNVQRGVRKGCLVLGFS